MKNQETNLHMSVILAAYNEGGVIEDTISQIFSMLSERVENFNEVIVVNDGSSDDTKDILAELSSKYENLVVINLSRNYGQGRALRSAFDIAKGKIFITLDADLSYHASYIWKLYDTILENNVEIILASPYMQDGSVKNVPWFRYVCSRLGNKYLSKMNSYDIKTSTCVVRAYKSEVLNNIFLISDGMELQLEILMKSSMLSYKVMEIPADLKWPDIKTDNNKNKRKSKMKIINTVKLYLQMGWLFKPASIFILFSLLLITIGFYIISSLMFCFMKEFAVNIDQPESVSIIISNTLKQIYHERLIVFFLQVFFK